MRCPIAAGSIARTNAVKSFGENATEITIRGIKNTIEIIIEITIESINARFMRQIVHRVMTIALTARTKTVFYNKLERN